MADEEQKETILHGIAASPGIAIGEVLIVNSFYTSFREPDIKTVEPDNIENEIKAFERALDVTRAELRVMQKRIQAELDDKEASIFDAHLLIVDDRMILNEVEMLVKAEKWSAAYAFYSTINRYVKALAAMPDVYIRERADDIKDVASRILSNLHGNRQPILDNLGGKKVIVAHDLTPSATALLDRENVLGFAVGTGSQTSHTAILARSMKIPAIVGVKDISITLKTGDKVIIDGYVGNAIIHPTESTIRLYHQKETQEEKLYAELIHESRLRPETLDGFRIQLAANVDGIADVKSAKRFGTAGVGLFRTEYLFINKNKLPTENEQFEIYREMISSLNGHPVTIRTLDLGGDKLSETLNSLAEPNPFLGLRAVRLCLRERPDILRTQLRAMLRASVYGSLKILFPMITSTTEVTALIDILNEIKADLKKEKISFKDDVEIGIMIETPAAALIAEALAELVDFFSIGSNDLIQYTLAVDRGNERVAYLYLPTHPAVLGLIEKTVSAARRKNIWVSVCGEMAGVPQYTPLLVGLGVHELSMSPMSLGTIRRTIRKIKMHEAEDIAQRALKCTNAQDALDLSVNYLREIAPDVFDLSTKGL